MEETAERKRTEERLAVTLSQSARTDHVIGDVK